MAEEKCYSLEKDGTYCLGFPNKFALTEKEIEVAFSEFGDVISVRASGDERGFRFVRFRSLEEAESAVEGLKGNKKIRILPKKAKNPNLADKNSLTENQKNVQQKNGSFKKKVNPNYQSKKKDDFNHSSLTDNASVTQSPNRKKFQVHGGTYNSTFREFSNDSELLEKRSDNDRQANLMKLLRFGCMRGTVANNFTSNSASNFSEENYSKSTALQKGGNQNNQEQCKVKRDDDLKDSSKTELNISQSPNCEKSQLVSKNLKTNVCSDAMDPPNKFISEEDKKLLQKLKVRAVLLRRNQSDVSSNFGDKNVFEVQEDAVTTILTADDELPELISFEELKQRSMKGSVCGDEFMKVAMAEEVIVANIHKNFSVLYILYLLEKFEPISITEIKTISENGVRYCSVYFKSQKDAIAVEKLFDNFDLSGNKLIVRTPHLLVNEVAAA